MAVGGEGCQVGVSPTLTGDGVVPIYRVVTASGQLWVTPINCKNKLIV